MKELVLALGIVWAVTGCAKFRAVNHDHDAGHAPVNCAPPAVKLVECRYKGDLILQIYVTSILSIQQTGKHPNPKVKCEEVVTK